MVAVTPELPPSRVRGKAYPARTVILATREVAPGLTELEVEIETGVMHQIRAHLAHMGWPLLGDPVYRGTPSRRLWLHAETLEFPLRSGIMLQAKAALPPGWPGTSSRESL
jgi:23S rRNA-/tRNA-specific pseudouridylate synthase